MYFGFVVVLRDTDKRVHNQLCYFYGNKQTRGGILVIREAEKGRRVVSDLILVFLSTVPLSP